MVPAITWTALTELPGGLMDRTIKPVDQKIPIRLHLRHTPTILAEEKLLSGPNQTELQQTREGNSRRFSLPVAHIEHDVMVGLYADGFDPLGCNFHITIIAFNANPVPMQTFRHRSSRSSSKEWVKDEIAGVR